jgi:hypothetical protein
MSDEAELRGNFAAVGELLAYSQFRRDTPAVYGARLKSVTPRSS